MDKVTHSLSLLVLLFAISGLLIGLVYWLFALYQDRPSRNANWLLTLQLSADDLGGFGYGRLALISLLSLFLEMQMIRWISRTGAVNSTELRLGNRLRGAFPRKGLQDSERNLFQFNA